MRIETPRKALQLRQLSGDGPLGRSYRANRSHDGLAARGSVVLEADPQALAGDVGGRQGLGLEGRDGSGIGG